MSKNVKLESIFKNEFIASDDLVFKNYNETDVLIREEAQFLFSQLNHTNFPEKEEELFCDVESLPESIYENKNTTLIVDDQNKMYSVIEKNNEVLTDILEKISFNFESIKNPEKNKDDFDKFLKMENSFYEFTEKNNSNLIDHFNNEILEIKQNIKIDKTNINETNKEILSFLENQDAIRDVLNNKDLSKKIDKSIEDKILDNNAILNKNLNICIDEIKQSITNLNSEVYELNSKEDIERLSEKQNNIDDKIDFFKKEIYTKFDDIQDDLKKLDYRKELDNLLTAQFHYSEKANSSQKELEDKISNVEASFLNHIQIIESKLNSNLNIINDIKNSYNSDEIDNLITDKLVTIVQEKINTIDSKMLYLKKEIEKNLSNLIENQFEANITKNDEYNKKIKNETLNIIYSELNRFNNKFENLNEEIVKNYDLLMINNRVLDTLEDLLTDQYSKKNDLDIERKNLIDELIKKAEHNKELIIILQNKIDYSIDNTDLYNSIIRKTISRDSDVLREIDDQTYNYVKNLTLELVSKELGKYTNFVKTNDYETEIEKIELNSNDNFSTDKLLYTNTLDNESPSEITLNSNVLDDISLDNNFFTPNNSEDKFTIDEIIDSNLSNYSDTLADEIAEIEDINIDFSKEDEVLKNKFNFESNQATLNNDTIITINNVEQNLHFKDDDSAFKKDVIQNDHSGHALFKNDNNPYFNYKIKELLILLMSNENKSIANDIAFYKTNLLNQNTDYLNHEDYLSELEDYFSEIENKDRKDLGKGESNE